jgi:nitrite reductase/ring-hydroxylating ferredoxin subunit
VKKTAVADWQKLEDRKPAYALVANVDLVLVRHDDNISVFYGRCLHRGALLADGFVKGDNLICGVHYWDFRIDTGISEYDNEEALPKFSAWVEEGRVWVDEEEIAAWEKDHPQAYKRSEYLGLYADHEGTDAEPHNGIIQQLAKYGLKKLGNHGPVAAMGVPRQELPTWDDVQFVTAQLATAPLLDDEKVGTDVVIGPAAKKPLALAIPLFVSDMSFGALSEEAKVALATGAEMAKTGICSGEGGMLEEEQAVNSRYFYELASARFGFSMDKVKRCQAFHFKGGQGAKTGTGGHLPGKKVKGKIARVRGLKEGEPAVSPRAFPTGRTPPPSASSPSGCARKPAVSPSATSSPPSTSKKTSTRRWMWGWTTSSWTGAAAAPGPRRSSFATTYRCRRCRRWRAPAATSTGWREKTSPW